MSAYATELVTIITTSLASFLGGVGEPLVNVFYDLFVVITQDYGPDTIPDTADDIFTYDPTVLAYVVLTWVGVSVVYKFLPMVLKLIRVKR